MNETDTVFLGNIGAFYIDGTAVYTDLTAVGFYNTVGDIHES